MATPAENGESKLKSVISAETSGDINGDQKPADVPVPEWLKPELFENVLKKTVPEYKNIKNFKVNKGVAAGENYATVMLRVNLEVLAGDDQVKNISYMLKVPHDNEQFKQLLKQHNMFDVEHGMYLDIVPEMEQMYKDVGLDVKFGAECYNLPTENLNVMLEDLKPRGFKNTNRLEGLDVEHTKTVLRKLALWHAASSTRVELKGRYPDLYTYGFFVDTPVNREFMTAVNNSATQIFLKCAKQYKGSDVYYNNLEKLQLQITDEVFKSAKIDSNEFNVLNHGDCWSNNIMFQYDAFGKIKETYFIDFQLPKYGSPAQDLYYFLLSSTKFEIKLKQFEYFIKYYHDHLTEALKLLNYPKKLPSLKDIHISLYRHGVWGYTTASSVMAGILLDPNENANVENFLSDSADGFDFKMLLYSNARYLKHIEAVLPWLYNRGALEC